MASAFSTYLINQIGECSLRGATWVGPQDIYLALYSSNPTPDNTGNELSGNGYARVAVEFSPDSQLVYKNQAIVPFLADGGDWDTVLYFALFDAQTNGNMLYFGQLGEARTIADGEPLTAPYESIQVIIGSNEIPAPLCTPAPALVSSAVDHANFPITAAGFATACGVPEMLPSRIFNLQEASGQVFCALTNEVLVPGLVTGDNYSRVDTTGLVTTRTAIQFEDYTDDCFVATNSSFMRPGNGPFAAILLFKSESTTSTSGLMGYGRGINGSPALEEGGIVITMDSLGRIGSGISDGTAAVGGNLAVGNLKDGGWHMAGVKLNSAGTVTVIHESGLHNRDASSLSFPADAKGYFRIGANRYKSSEMQCAYLVCFEDSGAVDAITSAGLATFLAQVEA